MNLKDRFNWLNDFLITRNVFNSLTKGNSTDRIAHGFIVRSFVAIVVLLTAGFILYKFLS